MSNPALPKTPRMDAIATEVRHLMRTKIAMLVETEFDPDVAELATVARAFAESILASGDTAFEGLMHAFVGGVFWERGRAGVAKNAGGSEPQGGER